MGLGVEVVTEALEMLVEVGKWSSWVWLRCSPIDIRPRRLVEIPFGMPLSENAADA